MPNAPLPEWEYLPGGWPVGDARGSGWDHPSIAPVMTAALPDFIRIVTGTEPLGIYPLAPLARSESGHNVSMTFGYALGRSDDLALQHRVLRAALDLLAEPAGPVLRDFPDDAVPGDQPPAPAQASGIAAAVGVPDDPALETTRMRQYHEQWLARCAGRTAFGLSGVPATRCGYEFFGADHVVFASDTPLGPIAPTIKTVQDLGLPAGEQRKIFVGNAERLLNMKFS